MDDQFEDFRARISSIAHRVCPRWLSSEVDDLVQVASIRVWDKIRGEGNATLSSSYLWKVAHSVLIDEIRRARRRKEVELGGVDAMLEGPRTEDPRVGVASQEAGRAIRECLSTLVRPRRRAVTAYLLGHTVPETSRLLRWSPKKTENLVYRGLEQLRSCLRQKGVRP